MMLMSCSLFLLFDRMDGQVLQTKSISVTSLTKDTCGPCREIIKKKIIRTENCFDVLKYRLKKVCDSSFFEKVYQIMANFTEISQSTVEQSVVL